MESVPSVRNRHVYRDTLEDKAAQQPNSWVKMDKTLIIKVLIEVYLKKQSQKACENQISSQMSPVFFRKDSEIFRTVTQRD